MKLRVLLAAGCDAYIEKPIDPDTFSAQVEAAVAFGRRSQDRAP